MIRRIYCTACEKVARRPMDPEDHLNHWQDRVREIIAQKPKEHYVKINDERIDLRNLICDHCGRIIPNASKAFAYTAWRTAEAPPDWEHQFSTPPT